jgi:hypothetical protein
MHSLHLHPRTDSNSDMNNPESPFGNNPPIKLVLDVYKKQLEIIEDDFVSQVADNLASNLASQGYFVSGCIRTSGWGISQLGMPFGLLPGDIFEI